MTTTSPGTITAAEDSVARDVEGAVLVPVLGPTTSRFAVETASTLADSRNAELILASTDIDVPSPSLAVLDGGSERVARRKRLAETARNAVDVPVDESHRPRMRPAQVVSEIVRTRDVDTVVVERPVGENAGGFPSSAVERIEANMDCDVVVVSGSPPMGTVSSILLAVAGGPHSWSAAGVARDVAGQEEAWVDVMHVVPPNAGRWKRTRGRRIIGTAMDRLGDDADEWLYEAGDVADVLVEQSQYYDLTVLGAPRKSRLQKFVSGSTTRDVRRDSRNAVLTARRAGERRSLLSHLVG